MAQSLANRVFEWPVQAAIQANVERDITLEYICIMTVCCVWASGGSSRPCFANWDEEAIQALRWAIRAGVTRGELGGEPQSSSSSLEATSDGAAELSEGGEGGHGSSSSGQKPSEVARD
eukprot:Tamp_29867.p2 GENE.Tamp_29867~~Tamp_29867.p2  ORF type:complete len:119 (-),score=19.87 Tamp_29867:50-406(-)